MLGAWLQRTPIFYIQQSASSPAGEVGRCIEAYVPEVRRRVYQDDSTKRPYGAREVQATTKLVKLYFAFLSHSVYIFYELRDALNYWMGLELRDCASGWKHWAEVGLHRVGVDSWFTWICKQDIGSVVSLCSTENTLHTRFSLDFSHYDFIMIPKRAKHSTGGLTGECATRQLRRRWFPATARHVKQHQVHTFSAPTTAYVQPCKSPLNKNQNPIRTDCHNPY